MGSRPDLSRSSPRSLFRGSRESRLAPYLFLAPFLILFTVFTIYPAALGVYLSLTKWTGAVGQEPELIGLSNYRRMLKDPSFLTALTNTVWLAVAAVIVIVPTALFLAMVLNTHWIRLRTFLRTAFFLPIGTPTVVIAMVFIVLYSEHYGALNWLLGLVGLGPFNFTGTPAFVKPAILGLLLWQWTSVPMIYFLAGLQGIPPSLYDAAAVDGAGPWSSFRRVTLPLLRPVTLLVLVLLVNDAIRIFDQIFILMFFTGAPYQTSGGPGEQGLTLVLYMYRSAFRFRELGFGAAVGISIFVLGLGIALVQLWRFGALRKEGGGAGY